MRISYAVADREGCRIVVRPGILWTHDTHLHNSMEAEDENRPRSTPWRPS
jgi:hypothetical protein